MPKSIYYKNIFDCPKEIEIPKNKKFVNLYNYENEYLKVIYYVGNNKWLCQCKKCGNYFISNKYNIRNKHVKSCGCLKRIHNEYKTRINIIWNNMIQRCTNPNNISYKNYGGRGISVCDEWKQYINFSNWAKKNGYKDYLSLDRINNDKDYSPENCRWVTLDVQGNNKKNNVKINIFKNNLTIAQWSNFLKINDSTLRERLKSKKYSNKELLLTPKYNNKTRLKGIYFENYSHYKYPVMVCCVPFCDFKCTKNTGENLCQNCDVYNYDIKTYENDYIIKEYLNNPITKAITFAGFEPIWSFFEILNFIKQFREHSSDYIIIYTGYYPNEIKNELTKLKQYDNIIVKFGRFIPNQPSRYDEILGVTLASNNQYAEVIS